MANRNPNTKGLIPWKPGQSGNPSGRPRTQPISDRYAHIAEEKLPENIRKKLKLGPGATYGDAIALRTFQVALEGDIAATREVREAIEGFLGFTHICGQARKNGKFLVLRKSIRKRLLTNLPKY